MNPIFITGGTGYLGVPLIQALLAKDHKIQVLTRMQSAHRVPPGARPVPGDALNAASFERYIPTGATLVHLVGTPHPNPAKAAEFRRVDLASIRASVVAAKEARVRHFVYLSVAHPAPVMRAYIDVRREGEALVSGSGIPATILRPWYVLGPGHRWVYALLPVYKAMEMLPPTRDMALRLGTVTLAQMTAALANAVESPPEHLRVLNVADIRRFSWQMPAEAVL